MTTIYLRVIAQDIPRDKKLLADVGNIVSNQFIEKNLHGRIVVEQTEPSGTFRVWAYPDSYTDEIDKAIQNYLKPKRRRIKVTKVNG